MANRTEWAEQNVACELTELTGLEEHLEHENGAYGDARRCPRHPNVKTSSDDGMFDGVCGECEHAYDLDCEGTENLSASSLPLHERDALAEWDAAQEWRHDAAHLAWRARYAAAHVDTDDICF